MIVSKNLLDSMAEKRALRLSALLAEEFQALYPQRCRTLGEKYLQEFTQRCALDAHRLGCQNYGELKAYAFIALHLGVDFAKDPHYPWVRDILAKEDVFSLKMEAISKVFFKSYYLADAVKLEVYKKALEQLEKVNFQHIKTFTDYTQIAEVLEAVYPERVKELGGVENVSIYINLSSEGKAKAYNIEHPIGVFIYATLTFFLGSGSDNDALYHWVRKYLNNPEADMTKKVDKFVKVTRKRVRNNIRHIEKTLEEIQA
ncbi:MAG: hypothetical protein GQ531_04550 [Sulfurovum sp.]|nr:hypothetical protein [Sulfurovum sp.]